MRTALALTLAVVVLPVRAVAQNAEGEAGFPQGSTVPRPGSGAPVGGAAEPAGVGGSPHSPSTWRRRWDDPQNRRHGPSAVGAVGLVHVTSAEVGPVGVLRLGLLAEYFKNPDFPVVDAQHRRSAGTLSLSWVPLSFLEAYLAYGATANTNSRSSPPLIQALGDLTLGVKLSHTWAPGLAAGVDLRGYSFSGVGNQEVDRWALGFSPRLLVSYDLRAATRHLPLVTHLEFGGQFDDAGDRIASERLSAAEEYSLGVNRYDRLVGGVALEAPLPFVTPFVEYTVARPMGVPGGTLVGPDGRVMKVSQVMPQTVGTGLKVTAIRDLTLTAAVDLGLHRNVGLGVPATPPWNLLLGAAFAVDPLGRTETRVVEQAAPAPAAAPVTAPLPEPPRRAAVGGVVRDASTGEALEGAIVAVEGAGLPVASEAGTGRFLTHELPFGPVRLVVRKDGYEPRTRELVLGPGAPAASVEVALVPEVKRAVLKIAVTAAGQPLPSRVKLEGPVTHELSSAKGEPVSLPEVPAGKYTLSVDAEGHLSQTRVVEVGETGALDVAFELSPQPKKRLVIVRGDKLEILQQVRFATGKATLLADSHPLLDQVVDALVKNGVRKLRVEGHTDNKGSRLKNLRLSQERAGAVGEYLVKKGVPPEVVETVGFGDSRPLAPNLTARGRELNRRVEFVILER